MGIFQQPVNDGILYVSTFGGIFRSLNNGENWIPWKDKISTIDHYVYNLFSFNKLLGN